jgi:HD-GYP domain-containing protein (c-di-GMP phosphodiesterase class II)
MRPEPGARPPYDRAAPAAGPENGAGSDPHPAVRVSEVLGALSFALDLTEGQPFGHALRSCLIGMHIARALDLPMSDRRDLYYAALLKDVGCSSNAARVYELFGGDERTVKHDLKRVDWTNYFIAARYAMAHAVPGSSWFARARRVAALAGSGTRVAHEIVEMRCARGGQVIRSLGFGPRVEDTVMALDEHWDGHGRPRGLKGNQIPLLARILSLAQTVEVFSAVDGPRDALAVARARRGTWFDPMLVSACEPLEKDIGIWCGLDDWGMQRAVREVEPGDAALLAGAGTLDRLATGFAAVVDAKSPFTARHSARVTEFALRVAGVLGLPAAEQADLKRAALLHDLGKLSVPNSILDKPAPLSGQEWEIMRLHPYFTQRILDRVEGFQDLAFVASSHHERLDGRGYFRGLRDDQVPLGARILAVADIYEALTAERPYRPALAPEAALKIMERDRAVALSADCLDALARSIESATIVEPTAYHVA